MQYIKLRFTKGLNADAYQEVDENGSVVSYRDLTGNLLTLPKITESTVIDPAPPKPSWGI